MKGCQPCPRGFACNSEGIDYLDLPQKRCANGRDCDQRGTTESKLLNIYGKYSLSGIVKTCPPGTYHFKIGATSIVDCVDVPAGFFARIHQFSGIYYGLI